MRTLAGSLLACALHGLGSTSAAAHEGHDHGAQPAPRAVEGVVRTSAATPDVEMVAVLEGTTLKIYLDRYATNEPLADAAVEIESAGFKATAAGTAAGTYAAPAAVLARPGRHALTVTVQAGELSELLSATLQVSRPAAGPDAAGRPWRLPASSTAVVAVGAAAALLLAAIAWRLARRRTRSNHGSAV